jgi:hypothetical protein
MKKRFVSLTLVIIFTIILFYFLSTKTSLQLFVKTTKADGQSTSYGVDVINFNRPIGIKECDSVNPSATGNVILKYTDKPYTNQDADHTNPAPGSPSLFATKDNGGTWINLLSGGGNMPKNIIKYQVSGIYNYTPGPDVKTLRVILIGAGCAGNENTDWTGAGGGGVDFWILADNDTSYKVVVGKGGRTSGIKSGSSSIFTGSNNNITYAEAIGGRIMQEGGGGYRILHNGVIGITGYGEHTGWTGGGIETRGGSSAFGIGQGAALGKNEWGLYNLKATFGGGGSNSQTDGADGVAFIYEY